MAAASRPLFGRVAALALAALVLLGLAATAAEAKPGGPKVTVMTRNLYLGTDLIPIAVSRSLAQFEERAAAGLGQVLSNDFPARAKLIAREVKRTRPDFIGLQEVAHWRRSPRGVMDGPVTPAEINVVDYLAVLQQALKDAGLHYRVARVQDEADVEGPTAFGFDARLTMRDAILVKSGGDLHVQGTSSGNFATRLEFPTVAGTFVSLRGWTAVDARFRGREIRFVNTHLEAYGDDLRAAQAQELIAPGGPLQSRRPVILVGDLNSDPAGAFAQAAAFQVLTGFGFVDSWLAARPGDPGLTCCHAADLRNLTVAFTQRIDHVLSKPGLPPWRAEVVGADPDERTPAGLWPSDHAGVVTTLRLPFPGGPPGAQAR
ncbi:MAG: endonuclease/exonuclease/phosphatase family protein [Thermoleophilaceae bacterium]|nr:endonuclease/exonuclease/phosphatase family protein [Thermoleophilaceae bacterium]